MDVANDLEHTVRVVWLAMLIARMEGVKNEEDYQDGFGA